MNQIPVLQLADWFLAKESMTHKKLQKLCYYGVAWGWTLLNRDVINDDQFEAWVHGPVAPKLWRHYRTYGWNLLPQPHGAPELVNDMEELLESVWITYGDKSGNELEALSHSEKPWIVARAGLNDTDASSNPIDPEIMKQFYTSIKSTDF